MAAGFLRADPPGDRGAVERAEAGASTTGRVGTSATRGAEAPLEELLGRATADADRARAEAALAAEIRTRLEREVERLERQLRDAEAERLELLARVEDRDRLLSRIFGSRSWRFTQALRRLLGRR